MEEQKKEEKRKSSLKLNPRTCSTIINSIKFDDRTFNILNDMASLFSTTTRKIFAHLVVTKRAEIANSTPTSEDLLENVSKTGQGDLSGLVSTLIQLMGLTKRQVNSCCADARTTFNSRISNIKKEIKNKQARIALIDKYINKTKNKKTKTIDKFNKEREKLEQKIEKLTKKLLAVDLDVAFGGKKLFNEQFKLAYSTEEEKVSKQNSWKTKWVSARNKMFSLVGSHEETAGNQSCQLVYNKEAEKFSLRLRLAPALESKYNSKYVDIHDIDFGYLRAKKHLIDIVTRRNTSDKESWRSLAYKFERDDKYNVWRLYVTYEPLFSMTDKQAIQDKLAIYKRNRYAVIGVDINVDHLAVAELDNNGNIINSYKIPMGINKKLSSKQRRDIIGRAVKELIEISKKTHKAIVLETLGFEEEKNKSLFKSKKQNFTLSTFAYERITSNIVARAKDNCIPVYFINPKNTSTIGGVKFRDKYNLTGHAAAAAVIGRRHFDLSERPGKHSILHRTKNGKVVTVPVWNPVTSLSRWWTNVGKSIKQAGNRTKAPRKKRVGVTPLIKNAPARDVSTVERPTQKLPDSSGNFCGS